MNLLTLLTLCLVGIFLASAYVEYQYYRFKKLYIALNAMANECQVAANALRDVSKAFGLMSAAANKVICDYNK